MAFNTVMRLWMQRVWKRNGRRRMSSSAIRRFWAAAKSAVNWGAYFDALAKAYPKQHVPPDADLVCYWFDKARRQIGQGKAKAAGLVSTNSIRGGTNRTVLDNICQTMPIFEAWPTEDWFDAGTAVRVSLVCFGNPQTVG
jgi:hypothetical protein